MEGEAEKIPRRGGKGLSKAETCLVYPGELLPSSERLEGSSDKYRGPYCYPVSSNLQSSGSAGDPEPPWSC